MSVISSAKELNILRGLKTTNPELNLIHGLKKNGAEINHEIDSEDQISISAALKGSYPSPSYLFGVNDDISGGALTANDATERMLANNHLMITVNSITLNTELMPNTVDRDFSGASAWANVDINAYDETGDLTITANAADQYCTCPVASAPTVIGRAYTMTFEVANLVKSWTIKSFDNAQTLGTVSADGTNTISWTATTTGGYRIVSVDTTSSADFDDFTLTAIVQGGVLITGDSTSEASGIPSIADTEYMVIDRVASYQTSKKWYRITSVVVLGSGITAINYDLYNLGYWDALNNNFSIHGYRMEVVPTHADNIDFQLQLYKVQDDGGGRVSIVTMEDIDASGSGGTAGGGTITDNLRTGSDARDYDTGTANTFFKIGTPGVIKQTDFEDFFKAEENICMGDDKDEGIIGVITWDNVDYITGFIAYHHHL